MPDMSPAEFDRLLELAKRGGALSAAEREALAAEIDRRLAQTYGKAGADAIKKEIAEEYAKDQVKNRWRSRWWGRLWIWLRGGLARLAARLGMTGAVALLVVALAWLGYSIYNAATSKPGVLTSGPPCGGMIAINAGPVSDSSPFLTEMQLFNNAMAKAQAACDAVQPTCPKIGTPPAPTCKPNVSLQTFDIDNWFVWRQVTLKTYNCTCEMLP